MIWRYCENSDCRDPIRLPDYDAPQCKHCQAIFCCDQCLVYHTKDEHPHEDNTPLDDYPPVEVNVDQLREMMRMVAASNAGHPGYPSAGWTQGRLTSERSAA